MREILFRGKKVRGGEWSYGVPVQGEVEGLTNGIKLMINLAGFNTRYRFVPDIEGDEVIPETVGQFTGLYDSRGNKVFEGDVLKIERVSDGIGTYFDPPLEYPAKVVVKWDFCAWTWEVYGQDKYYLHFPDAWCHYVCEIVGNIHDNPEYVKEENK